ncbi:hypothetical protein Syun_007942 [Stephania yunnanensis]|uniref:Uncharacterized protein n=1 Tax=Stephania yunnanensis TaxID=152371 RepID=A0AAP0KZI0_9MAGN
MVVSQNTVHGGIPDHSVSIAATITCPRCSQCPNGCWYEELVVPNRNIPTPTCC